MHVMAPSFMARTLAPMDRYNVQPMNTAQTGISNNIKSAVSAEAVAMMKSYRLAFLIA
jgi:hypothetical protein